MFDRQTIINAFAKTPRPADESLTECDCEECRWDIKNFIGKRWSQLTWDVLNSPEGDANIFLLTSAAFHYFLPGFLLLSLDDPNAYRLAAGIVSRLTASDRDDDYRLSNRRKDLVLLTPRQREVLAEVVSSWEPLFRNCMAPVIWQSLITSLRCGELVCFSWDTLMAYNAEICKSLPDD